MPRHVTATWCVWLLLIGTAGATGPTISFDSLLSEGQGGQQFRAEGHASGQAYFDSQPALLPGFVQNGTHDWGNHAFGSSTVAQSATASSEGFVWIDGDTTDQVRVRFSTDALLDSQNNTFGYSGFAGAEILRYLVFKLDGLTAGQLYTVHYNWNTEIAAGLPLGAGDSVAMGSLMAFITGMVGPPPLPLFDKQLLGLDGQGAGHILDQGTGTLEFIAPGPQAEMQVSIYALASANFAGGAGVDDLVGATFLGDVEFRLVPEPATLGLLACGLVALCLRAYRRRGAIALVGRADPVAW